MNYWLMKSEPDVFSIDDLERAGTECWNGVRNYQARNMLRDQMQQGDLAFFYHSSCDVPGITGIMRISRAGYPDATAFDTASPYYDAKSTAANPRWYMVDVQLVRKLKHIITLQQLKTDSRLQDFALLRRGNRLSVLPVSARQWKYILSLE
ncbi:MAG TPA: EVE domain-containing protein [Gammaproteobacteria bacterium]